MAAIFGSPFAAILLAIELLLFEFSPRSIIPVAPACITGAACHIAFFSSGPMFHMPEVPSPTYTALANYSRSEEHTSELQSLMRISYAVLCLKKKTNIVCHHQLEKN